MAQQSPLCQQDVLQLTEKGIDNASIIFKNVTLQSSKYICVREEGKTSVAIIDTATKNVLRLPVAVDSAIMNPVSKVIALRAQNNLQIYNLEMKTKMKQTQISADETVVFWKWINPKTIAIVTGKAVLHWSMDGDQQPQKMFDRAEQGQVQIINYRASADGKWLILGGIAQDPATGGVKGVLQVHSVEMNTSQKPMDAHAACFASITVDGRSAPSTLFCFTSNTDAGPRLNVIEVGVAKDQALKVEGQMRFQQGDFPVGMLPDKVLGVLYILTKMGFLFIHEIQSGKCIFGQQVSKATMFCQTESDSPEGGIIAVDQTGKVKSFAVNQKTVVPYICNQLGDMDLGLSMAKRYGLAGAEGYLGTQFNQLMQSQRYPEAMELAASSPQGVLRTTETINALKNIQVPGQQPGQMLLQYFTMLLNKGSLNAIESVELARPVLARRNEQGLEHIKGWLKENKLAATEELGDLLKNHNVTLALSVYLRANISEKVIGCFLTLAAQETNETQSNEHLNNILNYAAKFNYSPDFNLLLGQLMTVNSERAKDFALLLINHPDGSKVDVNSTVDAFMRQNDVKNTTFILLEYLKPRGDREEDGALQTRLLEINLLQMPQVADAIMDSDEYSFSQYDKQKVAMLCERAQLYQKALEHYTDVTDIKRVLTNSALINPQFLLDYFSRMSAENCLELLRDLLKFNLQANIRLVVEVAKKVSGDPVPPESLITLFEEFKSYHGIFFFLGAVVNSSEDSAIVFKYIEAAVKLNQLKIAEEVCRNHNHYDPVEVKEFLLLTNLKDPRPLIHVCDRFDYVDELTQYLYTNDMYVFIEAYVQRMSTKACPAVVGSLLDMNANEDQIRKLLENVVPPHDDPEFVDKLVAAVEHRNRLKLLRPFLEARNKEGSEDPYVHNGIAKINVDVNNQPKNFLETNQFYDSAVVGAYCETRDPHLAFVAYRRAQGTCDEQLVAVCNQNGFFKDMAKYLVERQDAELWAKVLDPETNEHRQQLIDQVVATALPESRVPEEVLNTVKAFMAAKLPNHLIELLERLILHGSNSDFNSNKNLQNLLIMTAIKADTTRVMNYVKQLENFDGPEIARNALQHGDLKEEAFFIYKKFKKGPESIGVLLDHMDDVPRAIECAEYWDQPEVWSILGKAQLDRGQIADAIKSYLKAENPASYNDVIAAAKSSESFEELITFLTMARKSFKDANIDGEMIYCYAKTDKLADLEEFINAGQVAKISDCGDRCADEGLYHAAKILYNHINNYAKLAVCLVKLGSYQEAVNAAQKANSIPTWKDVCFACVDANEFRLAQMCGINVLAYNEHLKDVIGHYETLGHFDEIIAMLEQGINLDRAQQAIYTQLGVMYAKYKEEKLMEHIKLFWSRLNIPTLLQATQENQHYSEAVFLYSHYDQFDVAVDVIIANSSHCWKHELFKETIKQAANIECYYKGITFYLDEHPNLLADLLIDLIPQNLDPTRVVNLIKPTGHLPLVTKYLLSVQRENVAAVNEAVNAIHVQEENYKALAKSIQDYDQIDQVALAMQLEHHELIEFRRISAKLFKLNKRWDRSLEISKKDELWPDCMETVTASKDEKMAEALLAFFVEKGQKECFAAMLFTCYSLIRADQVLEIAWRHGLIDFAMPFMIQCFKDFDSELNKIKGKFSAQDDAVKAEEDAKKKVEQQQQQTDAAFVGTAGVFNPMNTPLALAPPPGYGGGMGGMQQGYGMPNGGMQNGMGMGMQQQGFYQ